MDKENCKKKIAGLKTGNVCFKIDDGALVPIPHGFGDVLPDCVELLSRWRIENPSFSPTRFPVSDERTERWLINNILGNDYRVMFMIQNSKKKNIGHIGLSEMNFDTSTVRIDSVMKGIKEECPGIMGKVISFLKTWCKEQLNAENLDLVVLDDNEKAINLYQKCGFKEKAILPLRKVEHEGEVNWIEDVTLENPEKRFVYMTCVL